MIRFTILFLLLMSNILAFSQKDLGAWYMYFGNVRFSNKLSLHYETQWRQYKVFNDFQQSLTRVGLNYHIDKDNSVTAGYGFINTRFLIHTIDTEKEDQEFSNEHRIWQQYIQKKKVGRLLFDHRFRLEQQIINREGVNTYNNRTRYRVGVAVPITKKELIPKTIFFYWYDEVFLNISDTPFSQNRFYTALGYKLKENWSVQAGYLWWYTSQLNNRVQLGVFYNLDFRKEE